MAFLAKRRAILATILLVVACCVPAVAQEQRRGYYTPPASDAIHAVVAEHGMVVAQEKIAARLGADVLRRGGNAVDAAVATGFAMAVTYPRAGNIGGGGFMIIHSAERQADVAIDYRETAPGAMTQDVFLGRTASPIATSRAIPRLASACPARSPGWRWRWRNTARAVSRSRKS
jgi:gamma-glutamyltranspeptidase/glutathione hydrolase